MPFVSIRLVREVIADDPEAKKANMGGRIATAVSEVTGLPKDAVWVVFEEVAAADWFVGDRSVEAMRADKR